jgi:hypothetical protein
LLGIRRISLLYCTIRERLFLHWLNLSLPGTVFAFAVRLLFTLSLIFLTEIGVEENHPVVHNLEVLGQQGEISVELTQKCVNI